MAVVHSPEVVNLLLTVTGIWVAVNYLLLGLVLFPTLRFSLLATCSASLFFVFCAATHMLLAFSSHTQVIGHERAELYLIFHILQGIGGSVFVWCIRRGWIVVRAGTA